MADLMNLMNRAADRMNQGGLCADQQEVMTMKSKEYIEEAEKALPTVLRRCRYCGEEARLFIRPDRNYKGDKGFSGTMMCRGCGVSVMAFGQDEHSAAVLAQSYWQRGVLDA